MSDEFKLQWSVSLPPVAQYAKGHMFNFRGNTVEDLDALFDEVLAGETMTKALAVAELLTGAQTVTSGLSDTREAPDFAQNNGPAEVIRMCGHGKRTKRTGTSSKGPWVGWFCPLEKGDPNQCKAEFE